MSDPELNENDQNEQPYKTSEEQVKEWLREVSDPVLEQLASEGDVRPEEISISQD